MAVFAIGDSGLMIIGTPAFSTPEKLPPADDPAIANQQSGLLHADFGMDGEGRVPAQHGFGHDRPCPI